MRILGYADFFPVEYGCLWQSPLFKNLITKLLATIHAIVVLTCDYNKDLTLNDFVNSAFLFQGLENNILFPV
jgi:hypothetical protein